MAFFLLWLTVFIMFFQPVAVWPALAPFQPLRNAALLALVAYIFSQKSSTTQPFFSVPTNRFFIFFVLTQIISSFVMIWSGSAIEMFNLWLRIGIVYYLITQEATTEFRIRSLVLAIVLAIVYLSYFSLSRYVVDYLPGMRAGGFGWYDNPNDLSVILVPCIPMCIMLADCKSGFTKLLLLCIAGIFAFNILFTGSRNGLLGLTIAGSMSILFSKGLSRLFKGALLMVLLTAILMFGLKAVLSRSDLGGGLSGDDSAENRKEQWRAGVRMLAHNPVLGIGPGEFASNARKYGGIQGMAPHNTIVQVFAESGLLGGLSFLLFAFSHIYRNRKNILAGSPLTTHIFIALLGFWVCAIFSNRYYGYTLYVMVPLLITSSQNSTKRLKHD